MELNYLVKLDNTRLNNIINNADSNTENFIKSVGFSIEARAKMKAPVDTGALRNSIYTDTRNTSNIPTEKDYDLPRGSRTKIYVGPTMEYAIYVEFGTSRQSAQPYLIPAVEEVASQLNTHYRLILP